jgi:hypothetical protein
MKAMNSQQTWRLVPVFTMAELNRLPDDPDFEKKLKAGTLQCGLWIAECRARNGSAGTSPHHGNRKSKI